jgi:hypothetical protein
MLEAFQKLFTSWPTPFNAYMLEYRKVEKSNAGQS